MNVLVLSRGADTGGQGIRIKEAFDRYGGPEWKVRELHRTETYLHYRRDASWDQLEELYEWADLVHFKSDNILYDVLAKDVRKPVVIHWQGSYLRDDPAPALAAAERIGARQLVSTVDLLECAQDAEWLPYPADLAWFARYRASRGLGSGRPFVIAHAPTNRDVKGTAAVIEAVEQLRADGYEVELDLIEQVQWKVCLSRKGRAHLFVDQLHLGYGINAIEAWAMGLPVVCGVDNPDVLARMKATWGTIPFVQATPETLAKKLAELIDNAKLRERWAERGVNHVYRFHQEEQVVAQLKRVWGETITASVEVPE